MIQKVTAYKSSDDKMFGTIEEVQKHELGLLFKSAPMGVAGGPEAVVDNAVACIINNRDKVMDILSTGPKSRPAARIANGATRKKRTPRVVVAPNQNASGPEMV